MNAEASSTVRSPLERPLSELTEEDIAQLTREDCRRFLKEKGMRRPSWNKSQAIQQVISLKALLEARPEKEIRVKPPVTVTVTVTSPQVSAPSPRKEDVLPSPYRRRDPNPNPNPIAPPVVLTCAPPCGGPSPDNRIGLDPLAGQMTIFYDGKVSVYNDVTPDKARTIMQVAASPDMFGSLSPGPVQLNRTNPVYIGQAPVHTPTTVRPAPLRDTGEYSLARENDGEGPTGRQASLQRYLEKRKDRYKGKRIIAGSSPSNMDMMYLSQKFRGQTPNEQSSQSNTSSPTQPRPPCTPTRCNSIENQAQKFRISFDLNDDGGAN